MHILLQNHVISLVLVITVIAYLVYRQIRPRKISMRGLLLFPLVILIFIIQALPVFHPSLNKVIEIAITSMISIILGLLACRELHVYVGSTGKAMVKGSLIYFIWWVAAFVIKGALSIYFGETKVSNISQVEILIPVFLLLLIRNAYLYWKTKILGLVLH